MVKDIVSRYLKMNLDYADQLVRDLTPQQMTTQPKTEHGVIVNHATWQLGHIVTTTCPMAEILQDSDLSRVWVRWMAKQPEDLVAYPDGSELQEQWMTWFDTGSVPLSGSAAGDYPGKTELVSMLTRSHEGLNNWLDQADDAALAADMPIEAVRGMAPTIGHTLVLIVIHEMQHLGELSAWRRACGMLPMF